MSKRAVFRWLFLVASIAGLRLALRWISVAVQRRLNPVLAEPPHEVPESTAGAHHGLVVADLHSDALMWSTDLLKWNRTGHVDIPRLLAGNVALQVFSAVTSVPAPEKGTTFGDRFDLITLLSIIQLWPPLAWFDLTRRALYQAYRLRRVEARSRGRLTIVRRSADLADFVHRRRAGTAGVAAILSLEGAQAIGDNLSSIDALYDAGFRIVGLTHLADNAVGGAGTGTQRYGLTKYGREVVRRLEQKGMIIDLAHAAPALIEDVLGATERPMLVTHTGVKGICPSPRNLSDDEIRHIARRGGLIGIGFDAFFNGQPGIVPIVASIQYVARLAGVEHVGLGSDFDGTIAAPFDASGLWLLTEELRRAGFTVEEVAKIMGGNALRFLLRYLP